MATIPVQPLILKNAVVTVASDDFTAAFTSVTFEPDPQWDWVDVWLGDSVPVLSRCRWECRIGYLQDLVNLDSWTRFLAENAGASVAMTFTPLLGGDPIQATVMVVPGSIGGSATEQLSGDVSLPVEGSPTFVPESS